MRLLFLILVALASALMISNAHATGFTDLGQDIQSRGETIAEIDGHFRVRSEWLGNLDLDRGLGPTGQPLYPVPLGDPDSQWLTHSDMRLRTDLTLYAPRGQVAVKLRVDMLDNLALGSTPAGPPQNTISQEPSQFLNIERVYAEALTPFGLLAVGRMGSTWGLGMLTNGGDCLDCDSGDAADRIAFLVPVLGHIWALAYDIAFRGPTVGRASGERTLDLDPSDDVQAFTFATMRYHTPRAIQRRSDAGKLTLDYGMYFSFRWQENDVPAWYVPTSQPVPLNSEQVVFRGQSAAAADLWVRLNLPWARFELEAAYLTGRIEQASLLPGVILPAELESEQLGAAFESRIQPPSWPVAFGIDLGYASGDAAPGFGAFPQPYEDSAVPGQLDGPQANVPFDNEVNNFRFHPDYRVDRILFREIIGTVTDAVYIRPHIAWRVAELGPGNFSLGVAGVASWAAQPESTPSGESQLGFEIDPTLVYTAYDTFVFATEYAVFFPGSAFDNPTAGLGAKTAQLLRFRLGFGF